MTTRQELTELSLLLLPATEAVSLLEVSGRCLTSTPKKPFSPVATPNNLWSCNQQVACISSSSAISVGSMPESS
jgi:hypothetical protein